MNHLRPVPKGYLIVILLFFLCRLDSAGQDFKFNHLSTKDGLSNNAIFAITQDTTGYMWFATTYGLSMYDSKRFRKYYQTESDSSLAGNYVTALLTDSKGTLWVGTNAGLNRYDPQSDTFRRLQKSKVKANIDNINCIYEDSKGRIWVGTKQGLSLVMSRERGYFRSYFDTDLPGTPGMRDVWAIYEESENIFWVGTTTGLFRLSLRGKTPEYEEFPGSTEQEGGLHDKFITTIAKDSKKKHMGRYQKRGPSLLECSKAGFSALPGIGYSRQGPGQQ